ncbi:MAG: adenine phosphoribosyltransferase [Acholeplasmatales bacterium]|nr:adenine phosphoribosyltransferase [Acholeplasmatales bacterium]
MNLKDYIKNIPNYPKEGIIFRDITPLIQDADAFRYTIDEFNKYAIECGANKIASPEARGFIFGAPVSAMTKKSFALVRKPGKLPRKTISEEYSLEYGKNILCMHEDSIQPGDKVLIVDDLLATGGTSLAACHLIEKLGGEVVGLIFVIELVDLKGRETLKDYVVKSLVEYEGE